MHFVSDVALVTAGLLALFFGGDRLVGGAVALAERAGISPLVIGLTIVGFGTSAPELVTSIQAALDGSPGIAIGNVVGSNIANILLILGISALVAPIAVASQALRRDWPWMAFAAVLGSALLWSGYIGFPQGTVLLAGLAVYLVISFRSGASDTSAADESGPTDGRLLPALATFLVGLVLTLIGARLLVSGATSLAAGLGVPDAVIGLTIVAVGTSLPELVTSLTAARRGHADVALGNVIGSNIFNILCILGVTALIKPLTADYAGMLTDLLVMLGATGLLLILAATDRTISRREGGLLIALYGAYLVWLASGVI